MHLPVQCFPAQNIFNNIETCGEWNTIFLDKLSQSYFWISTVPCKLCGYIYIWATSSSNLTYSALYCFATSVIMPIQAIISVILLSSTVIVQNYIMPIWAPKWPLQGHFKLQLLLSCTLCSMYASYCFRLNIFWPNLKQ